jgi:hypothetical protein
VRSPLAPRPSETPWVVDWRRGCSGGEQAEAGNPLEGLGDGGGDGASSSAVNTVRSTGSREALKAARAHRYRLGEGSR